MNAALKLSSRFSFVLWAVFCASNPVFADVTEVPPEVKKNWRVQNEVGSPVLLTDIRPEKLFYSPDEDVLGKVSLWNRGEDAVEVEVQVWIEQGLDEVVGNQSRKVTIDPGAQTIETFSWPSSSLEQYGKALLVQIRHGDKVLAKGAEPFSSAHNVWEVGIAGGHPVAFTASHAKDLPDIESRVEAMRDNYINTFEKFFWAPDDFADMTPTKEEWFSGQVRYHENLERLKHLAAHGRRIGVLPTTYGKSIGSGTAARDFIRANPEMVYGFGKAMQFFPDTEELAKWDVPSDPYWQSLGWAMYNMNDPAVVQHGINEIIESTRQFGWAGVRFDGHFQARSGVQRVGDEEKTFSADDKDRQTAANHRILKEQVLKEFPDFVFGYNYAECKFDQLLQSQLRETLELTRDGGHIMDEYSKSNPGGNHPFRRWDDYAELIVRQAEQVRRLGGHFFPMTGTGAVGRYHAAFTFAAGAHPNGNLAPREFNRFATRYGSLLWGPSVRNVWNPIGLVVVPPGILWENYVREVEIDDNHRQLIIHLINPPIQETATETASQESEIAKREKQRRDILIAAGESGTQPDYSEIDNLPPIELFPAPKQDIPVRIIPQALGADWKAVRVVYLSADRNERTELTLDQSDEYFWQVIVPELQTWAVLVVELEKK